MKKSFFDLSWKIAKGNLDKFLFRIASIDRISYSSCRDIVFRRNSPNHSSNYCHCLCIIEFIATVCTCLKYKQSTNSILHEIVSKLLFKNSFLLTRYLLKKSHNRHLFRNIRLMSVCWIHCIHTNAVKVNWDCNLFSCHIDSFT